MDLLKMFKENVKFFIVLFVIILFGTIGVTYSLIIGGFKAININTTTAEIDASITYDTNSNGAEIISNGNMLPISDSLVTGADVIDTRVLKATFNVTGLDTNPSDTIYDIALHNIDIDCDLRTEDLKWRLYKGSELLSEGNLSPTFDTMANNRLVLTNTQEDLTTNTDKYTFLLWISEACDGDIASCDSSMDQSVYLNKTIKASIKVELSTKEKKELERITASAESCEYTPIDVPACNDLTYNGSSQTLVNAGDNYSLVNTTGTNAGDYAITVKLNDGYKWSNGATDDKILTCNIDKKDVTVTTLDQTIVYGSDISSTVSDVSIEGLISGSSLDSVTLNSSIVEVGTGTISTNNIKILDSNDNNATENYNIKKNNTGKITITCLNTAKEPSVSDKVYNGEEQVGVTGGEYITISGSKSAKEVGSYKVTAVPNKNYCWNDESTTLKEYTWNITDNDLNILLEDKTASYTGSSVSIDEPTITDSDGTEITNIPLTYKYYNGSSCSGTVMKGKPVNAGSYSVKAYTNDYASYTASESNCAKLTIQNTEAKLTLSTDSLSLTYPTASSFTYEYDGDGTLSCSCSDTNIATCEVDTTNKKVTVTPVGSGNAKVTLSASAGSLTNAVSKSINVTIAYNNYTITLNNQNATSIGTGTLYGTYSNGIYLDSGYSKKMTTSTNAITVPTRTGYTFEGYYTETNGNGTQLISASGYLTSAFTNVLYNNNVTLYAKWTVNSYTVTYDYSTNGGSSATKTSASVTYGNSIDLTATASKSGWSFVGWNTSSTATTGLSSLTMGTSNVKLYAIFKKEAITYTATTQKNVSSATGTATTASCTIAAVYNTATQATSCQATLPANPYTLTSWTFNGWVTTASGTTTTTSTSGTAASNKITLSSNVNIVATWKKTVSVSLTFDKNGGSANTTSAGVSTTLYNGNTSLSATLTFTAPSCTTYSGWTCLGYNTSSSSTSSAWNAGATKSISVTGTVGISATTFSKASGYYHIWRKTSTATFYYYSGSAQTSTTASCYMYNGGSSCSYTLPSAVSSSSGPSSTSYKGVSTSKSSTTTTTSYTSANTSYYAVYSASITATFYYSGLASDSYTYSTTASTTTASGTRSATTNGTTYSVSNGNITVPTAVSGSSGGVAAQNYIGVSKDKSSATTMTPTTAYTAYYAVYTENLTFYYYNGSAHTTLATVRRMLCDGSTYSASLNTSAPSPSAYDSASFYAWSYVSGSSSSGNIRKPLETGVNALYAVYSKTITISYNANGGSNAPSASTGTKYYTNTSSNSVSATNPSITLSSSVPTRAGYSFSSWNSASGGGGTSYSKGTAYTFSASATLYAIWTATPPTVSVTGTVSLDSITGTITASGNNSATISSYGWLLQSSNSCPTSGYTSGNASYTFSGLSNGTYYICVKVTDSAGNYTTKASSALTVSTTPFGTYITNKDFSGATAYGGLYRYAGSSTAVTNNHVCFGTSTKSTCTGNTDAYMYRIIGVDASGQVKLIKKEAMGTANWSTNGTATWPNSPLYAALNGSTYLTNSTYMPSGWSDKIVTYAWKYGDTGKAAYTGSAYASTYYSTENGWTNTVSAKVGLMYVHDYLYAYSLTEKVSQTNRKNGWIHFSNNSSKSFATDDREFTISRYGSYTSGSKTYYPTITLGIDGSISYFYITLEHYRPVIYLDASVIYAGGSGSSTDPYLIK